MEDIEIMFSCEGPLPLGSLGTVDNPTMHYYCNALATKPCSFSCNFQAFSKNGIAATAYFCSIFPMFSCLLQTRSRFRCITQPASTYTTLSSVCEFTHSTTSETVEKLAGLLSVNGSSVTFISLSAVFISFTRLRCGLYSKHYL